MDATHIKTKFEKLGAKATIRPLVRNPWRPAAGPLKPDLVRSREQGKRGKRSKRLRRKTDVFIRQGEWFFIPAPDMRVNEKLILPHEPIRRGGGKPHMCEHVRGKITHPDHATIRLDGWHRVEMNTENRSRAMASVAFLD